MRKSAGMREALKRTHITPQDKVSRIQKMADILQAQKALKQWDLKIEHVPVEITSRVMPAPQIFKGNQVIHVDENVLRKLPIQKAVDLKHEKWIMVYQHRKDRSNYKIADDIYNTFCGACKQLGVQVEEPYWIELNDENDKEELRHKLREYMKDSKDGIFRHPLICVAVLGYESNYPAFKEVFQSYQMPSQVITARNGSKFNLSKATNILRQINSKVGGDLFELKFPDKFEKKRTMLIGIDVCHAGPNSIVGFSASTNKEMSQYYSEHIIQKKG
jgi:thiol-disulfide isomerase/thioredoxin